MKRFFLHNVQQRRGKETFHDETLAARVLPKLLSFNQPELIDHNPFVVV